MSRDTLVSLFCELVQIDSLSKHEAAFASVIKDKLASVGLGVTDDGAGQRLGGDCGNLICKVPATADGFPVIMLNTHIDTVGEDTGIQPIVENDEIHSTGNTILGADAKAGIVS